MKIILVALIGGFFGYCITRYFGLTACFTFDAGMLWAYAVVIISRTS